MAASPFNPDLLPPPPPEERADGQQPISVSQLTAMVKRALSRLPGRLAVAGEISNFTRAASGHLYFTLKDASAAVRCVMWRTSAARLKFDPADGLAVVAFGSVDVYEARGDYQLYVSRLLPQGRGELELAFRQLHDRLERLGWFAADRKRPIPLIPRTIGLVTSTTGAAVRDILRTLALRWPGFHVVLADARVQGEGAGESVAAGIGRLNRYAATVAPIDVLIVARGGGSLEDLWAFNTEQVARAIFDSKVPIVTGVGHEVDVTIADLVADLRAATPTAAAQAVVPDRNELSARLAAAASLLARRTRQVLSEAAHRLAASARFEAFRRPTSLLAGPRQSLDELARRLERVSPAARLALARSALDRLGRDLPQSARRRLADRAKALDAAERQLAAYNPRAVLARGYSMTTIKRSGRLLTAAGQVRAGDRIVTELADGRIESDVAGPRAKRPADPAGPMPLFDEGNSQ